jgi:hypothetical protein
MAEAWLSEILTASRDIHNFEVEPWSKRFLDWHKKKPRYFTLPFFCHIEAYVCSEEICEWAPKNIVVVMDRTNLKGFKFQCTYSYLNIFSMLCIMRVIEKTYQACRIIQVSYGTVFQPYNPLKLIVNRKNMEAYLFCATLLQFSRIYNNSQRSNRRTGSLLS